MLAFLAGRKRTVCVFFCFLCLNLYNFVVCNFVAAFWGVCFLLFLLGKVSLVKRLCFLFFGGVNVLLVCASLRVICSPSAWPQWFSVCCLGFFRDVL